MASIYIYYRTLCTVMTSRIVDDLDRAILRLLREDGRMTVKDIATKLDRRRATIHNRIVKMEDDNIIQGYTVVPNFDMLDHNITVFILVTLTGSEYTDVASLTDVGQKLTKIAYITEVHAISGDYDYLLKARVPSLDLLGKDINFQLRQMRGVGRTLTLAAFDTNQEELSTKPLYQLDQS